MFGCIAAGRPVQTNLLALSPTQYTFLLPTSPTQPLNHLVVFLLPEASLPPDTAATVYIQLSPDKPFQLLGAIGNDKPSAIFRIKGLSSLANTTSSTGDVDEMTDETTGPNGPSPITNDPTPTMVTLGISIEPISSVAAALSTLPPSSQLAQTPRPATPAINTPASSSSGALILANSKPTTLVIARRIIRNAFNYLSGFAVKVEVPGQGWQDVVTLKAFQEWWVRFEKKVEFDPGVLERED